MQNSKNRVSTPVKKLAVESKHIVEDYAMSSALISFALGVGTGLAVTCMLTDSEKSNRKFVSQRLGQQLMDAMSGLIPQSLIHR